MMVTLSHPYPGLSSVPGSGPTPWGRAADIGIGVGLPAFTPTIVSAVTGGGAASGAAGGAAVAGGVASAAVTAGIAVAGIALATWLRSARLRGQQKIAATQIVNEAEPYLQANVDAWKASPKTLADKRAALANAQPVFDWLMSGEGCGNPNLAAAGQRCLSERMCREGSGAGCRFPWLTWYVDSIANDPAVEEIAAAASAASSTNPAGGGGGRQNTAGDLDSGAGMVTGAGTGTGTGTVASFVPWQGVERSNNLLVLAAGVLAVMAMAGMGMSNQGGKR